MSVMFYSYMSDTVTDISLSLVDLEEYCTIYY